MSICLESFKQAKRWLAGAVLAPLCVSSVLAAPPQESTIMPKAQRSMLLDVVQAGSRLVTVGERGHVLYSDDQGKTWVQAQVPTAQMLTSAFFVNDKLGWAVGHDGNIVHTADGGATWVLQRDGLEAQKEMNQKAFQNAKKRILSVEKEIARRSALGEAAAAEPLAPEFVVLDPYSGSPMSLEELLDEAKWEMESAQDKMNQAEVAFPLMDVWFADANNGWAAGAFGGLVQTTDGGKTWIDRSKDVGNADGFHLNAVAGTGNTVFIGGEAGFLIYSNDNGKTWQQADLGYDGTVFAIVADSQSGDVVATGLRGNTFVSSDLGVSWTALKPGVDFSLAGGLRYNRNNLILVGAGGTIAVSKDNGKNFKNYVLPARASLSGVVVQGDNKFLMVGQGGIHQFDVNSASAQ